MSAAIRIQKEFARMTTDPPTGCSAAMADNNLYQWTASITAPEDSVYAGGVFDLSIDFPANYPFSPPVVRFMTRIYHPNVENQIKFQGDWGVCIDILFKDQGWSPILTIDKVLLSILSLLTDPNPYHAVDHDIAKQYVDDRKGFSKMAREWTKKYAMGDARCSSDSSDSAGSSSDSGSSSSSGGTRK